MAKRNYVLDTSVYLTDANSIYKFDNHDIFIPLKVLEEVGETAGAMLKKKDIEIIDGLGDSFVTLIILCYQLGLEPKECLESAWNEIKDRKGKTVNGTFIRE